MTSINYENIIKKHIFVLTILFLLIPGFASAAEFGFVINQNVDITNEDEDIVYEYSALIVPRLYFLFGDTASLFVSAGVTLESSQQGFTYIPELLRTELSLQWLRFGVQLGRFGYAAPLSFLADGLFDGVLFTHSSGAGQFRIGGFYTGFLHKKSAGIEMTEYDRAVNGVPLDYDNFTNTYFAPPRAIASLEWEHLAVADFMRLNISAVAQFDFTDVIDSEKYDSQYLTAKIGLPAGSLFFELGGVVSTFQAATFQDDDSDLQMSYAGSAGVNLTFPTTFNSRLSFNARYASGGFIPITTSYAGDIFKAKLSALSVFDLTYTARFTEKFGINLSGKYFVRTDADTFNTFPITEEGDGGDLMGAEFFGRMSWSPVSDIQFSLGAGAFMPSFGDNWPDAKPVWKITLAAVIAVF